MTYEELKAEVEALVAFMQERGFAQCGGRIEVNAHEDPVVCMKHRLPTTKSYLSDYIWGRGDTPIAAIADARRNIADEPSPHDLRVRHALTALAGAMDAAKSAGIEDDLINPLQVISERLAKNALSSPPDTAKWSAS